MSDKIYLFTQPPRESLVHYGSSVDFERRDLMCMPREYGLDEGDDINTIPLEVIKEKAIKKKSDFFISRMERIISENGSDEGLTVTPQQKAIVDRAVRATYKAYLDHDFDPDYLPAMFSLINEIKSCEKKEV